MRIAYGQNEDETKPSDFDADNITIGFTESGRDLIAWVNRGNQFEGTGDPVTVSWAHGLYELRFRHDIGAGDSRVNCKRAFVGRGSQFRLMFDPARSQLFGTVWIMKTDAGGTKPCAFVLQLPMPGKSAS